jgi:hypothetical protein
MPLWIAIGLSGYATHLLWQVVKVLRSGTTPFVLFLAFLFFLGKFSLLLAASSYWSAMYCPYAQQFSPVLLVIPAFLALLEVLIMRSTVKEHLAHLKKSPRFFPAIALQILVTVVLPALLLAVAYNVLAHKQCA